MPLFKSTNLKKCYHFELNFGFPEYKRTVCTTPLSFMLISFLLKLIMSRILGILTSTAPLSFMVNVFLLKLIITISLEIYYSTIL
jgi:hypothetical protein